MTTLEKKFQSKVDDLTKGRIKIDNVKDSLLAFDDTQRSVYDNFSILDNYLDKYSLKTIKVKDEEETFTRNPLSGSDNESSIDGDISKPFLFPTEDQEEDIYDRGLLQSLSNNPGVSTKSQNNEQYSVGKSFYPRVSEQLKKQDLKQDDLHEQDPDTLTSSIFSSGINSTTRTSKTNIPIMEEDEDEHKI